MSDDWILTDGPLESSDGLSAWPIEDLLEHGLLWAMNTYIFHPRGYALIAVYEDDDATQFLGFSVLSNNGVPQSYPDDAEGALVMGMLFHETFPSPPRTENADA